MSKKEYIINSKIPEVDCLCPLCESVELICAGVNKCCDLNLPKKCHDLLERIACKVLTEDCANERCAECPILDLEMLTDVDKISFYHWVNRKYYEKELAEMSGIEMKEKLTEMFSTLKSHFYRKRIQSKMYKSHIAELEDNEMIIHVDYSENYKKSSKMKLSLHFTVRVNLLSTLHAFMLDLRVKLFANVLHLLHRKMIIAAMLVLP